MRMRVPIVKFEIDRKNLYVFFASYELILISLKLENTDENLI